jgi:hypothetical protein
MAESREEAVYLAKLAEQAERYDEMVEEMKKVAKMVDQHELTVEERNLLSVSRRHHRARLAPCSPAPGSLPPPGPGYRPQLPA